jgi:hypothetical protein
MSMRARYGRHRKEFSMNAVEIEEAVSELESKPFDREGFAYDFLSAFGNKDTTIKRLRSGQSNASDIKGGVLQRSNIHIAVCDEGDVGATLASLRQSPKTASAKAKFILATDGLTLEAEDLASGEVIASAYSAFAEHFGFFLPLAGISTVKEIKNNPIDVKATGRLNKLYVELLRDNPEWGTEEKRPELNQFMARLIFCFFAEDTGIFRDHQFTRTIDKMSDGQSGNTHEVLTELFRAMDTKPEDRATANLRNWADAFPYVNGGLFTNAIECPRFSRIARSYLLRAGELDWQQINPDIFGSMIQAVADDDERGELGMHYTSVPNILKVLNPLFLDDLREQLEAAGDNVRKLRNLRKRLSTIRVFDPACGSGNFLVIAYKEMRAIENEIVQRTGDKPRSQIPLSNFYGIEIKSFAAEIARLALLIAEFQADCGYISQHEARMMVLPLHRTGQIRVGNALRLDWLEVCPPTGTNLVEEHDLGGPTGRMSIEDRSIFDHIEPDTYIASNPPYKGRNKQSPEQKDDLKLTFTGYSSEYKSLDYVAGWFLKSAIYCSNKNAKFGLVSTNSICQGEQVELIWPTIFAFNLRIFFAHRSFTWSNLAAAKAGVTVVIVGVESDSSEPARLYEDEVVRDVDNIGPYLVPGPNVIVSPSRTQISKQLDLMYLGSMPKDGGHLLFSNHDANSMKASHHVPPKFIRKFWGAEEVVNNSPRYCLWIEDAEFEQIKNNPAVKPRLEAVARARLASPTPATQAFAHRPNRFVQISAKLGRTAVVVPRVTSENRPYLPVAIMDDNPIVGDKCYAIYDADLYHLSVIASRLHLQWIATVCSRLRTDFSYGNTLGWNTFPVPPLTDQNKTDLTRCAENILLTREGHFPATIADLYDPENMPDDLRRAHEENDEVLERIYIGRRFKNDTERLEKLFDLYTKMTAGKPQTKKKAKSAA